MDLWKRVFGYETTHNDPEFSIDQKCAVDDELFFVAEDGEVIGTTLCGYDGHRGWIYSLAVSPDHRRIGVGTALLKRAEDELRKLGCCKINLQILPGTQGAEEFYRNFGFATEDRINMGKVLFRPRED